MSHQLVLTSVLREHGQHAVGDREAADDVDRCQDHRIQGCRAAIVDTRKTTPGLRMLEKYAVLAGGGRNHRYSLSDGALIKDNHIAACGSISEAVRRVRQSVPHTINIEVTGFRAGLWFCCNRSCCDSLWFRYFGFRRRFTKVV